MYHLSQMNVYDEEFYTIDPAHFATRVTYRPDFVINKECSDGPFFRTLLISCQADALF